MFDFGEMEVREQNPWGYDATNDLPKVHGLYLAAAGLTTVDTAHFTALGAGSLGTGRTAIFAAVAAGKTRYVIDVIFSTDGPGLCEIDVDSAGVDWIYAGPNGGTVVWSPRIPLVVASGSTCGYTTQNTDSVARNQSVHMTVVDL